ncbi:MAG TPA: peptidoglycan DD-metalloendopeptidase family protein [Candidatus Rifleibacterium sp.]|nr:peptidoglycan DD-metalloendopeptidase family protein [Candidatus Rifleibacterium sp.]
MPFRRLRETFCLIALLLLSSVPLPGAPARTADTEELQNEIAAINLQLDYLKLKVSDSQKKTRSLEARIKEKQAEVAQLKSQVEQLTSSQAETTAQIAQLEEESKTGREQLKALLARFRARLVQLHKIRQGTLLSSVFSARDLNSFLNRYHMVKYLLQSDSELIEDLKKRDRQQRALAAELQKKHLHLEAGKLELDEKQKKLNRDNSALNAMLSTILLEKKLFLAREKELAGARERLENEISRAERSLQTPEFEEELKQPVAARPAPTRTIAEGRLSSSAPEAAKIMKFIWPVEKSARLSAQQSGDENSAALQIKVNPGTEIMTAAKGKVLYKGTISGLGDVIIIGHQRGFSTVYARLDNIWVGLNQIVEKGETIGQIAGGRNHALHFEIRFGGKKQLPLPYLPADL